MGARFVHDAGAGGQPVCVSDPRAFRVLRRALLHVLSTNTPHLTPVSNEVATALSGGSGSTPREGCHCLAVGLGRQGQSAFVLRSIPDDEDGGTRGLIEEQMLDALRHYLGAHLPSW